MDKFAAMRVFVKIADAGNLSAAGRQLGLSLTSVSRQLMALEEVLGTTLVERTTRHLALTESGRLYYERAKQILEEVAEMEGGLTMQTGVASGRLHVSAPSLLGRLRLAPMLPGFLVQQTRVSVDLMLVDRPVRLVEEGIDVALRSAGLSAPARRAGDAGRPHRARLPGLRRCTGRVGMELPGRRSAKSCAHSNPALRQ
jgi:DNA-binding transcriptional LysR family regulator